MDDETNGAYSRTPEIQDLIDLCKSLNDCKANYILIGGYAVILHGFTRGTKDIDLLVDTSKENIKNLKEALSKLPDNAIADMSDDDIENYQVVRVADEIVVDLMAKACNTSYEQAKDLIDVIEIEGIQIPVASKELLIRLKDTVRPHDKLDVEYLKYRIAEEKKQKP